MTLSRLAHYDVLRHLGSGGMGDVYAARDTKLGRVVALKFLHAAAGHDADRLGRFQREARLLASLNHPNIASIHGFEEAGDQRFLVMELVEGDTLAQRLARGPMPVEEVMKVAGQIVDALDQAHEQGVVHRDVKPGNIKITPNGVVKVLDFGLARDAPSVAAEAATVTGDGTRAGLVLGTAAYMSPEQARGQAVDKRTDIWAFGCVLYEMLTGVRAVPGDTFPDVIANLMTSTPDWRRLPPSTPALVRQLLLRLLDKDPKGRLRDIGDARWYLEAADPPAEPIAERARLRAPLLAAAVAVAVVGFTVASYPGSQPEVRLPIDETIVAQLTNYGGSETSAALSPDGRSFVFISDHGGTPDIWLRQTSGGEPVRLTSDAAVESQLVYAPDGEAIYFTRAEGEDRSIWRIGALGSNLRPVVRNAQVPAPSRDGRSLAWLAREGNSAQFSLMVGGSDGSEPRVLVPNLLMQTLNRPSWSPDGRLLAYCAGQLFETRNLFVVSVPDGGVRQVTRFERSTEGPLAADWLPDNRHLVVSYYASPRAQLSNDLGILDIETGHITRMTMNVKARFDEPSLSADGSRLVVTARENLREVWKVPHGPDPDENGRRAVQLLGTSQDPMWTYVTRDGQTLLYNNALAGSRNLWLLPLAGGAGPRQLTTIPGDAVMHSSLSPDGTHVAFVSSTSGNADIWVQNVDGSGLRQLTNDVEADAWPVWSPDGRFIMFASNGPGSRETRIVPAAGGPAERFGEGFFRGDWIARHDKTGTLMATSDGGRSIRLFDVERRQLIWEDRAGPNGTPMFSADGRFISLPVAVAPERQEIWTYETETGTKRVAARFAEPFQVYFRASWIDNDRAFVVNRTWDVAHVVMFDRFWQPSATDR